jgi:signal transduction histidine kinase
MKAKIARFRLSFMFLIFSISLVVGSQTWAQNSTIEFEKATLVSKFAKYVSWPGEERQFKFIIGVHEDVDKYNYFSDFFANKGVKDKDILVRLVKTLDEAKDVNLLYITSPNQRSVLRFTDKIIRNSNVLVITEGSKDLSKTMIDISYDKENSKIILKVFDDNIVDGQLTMPEMSYLLDNKDNEEILSVSPTFALKNEQSKQLLALQNKLAQQKSLLNQINKKLSLSTENSEKYYSALQQTSERLKITQQTDAKKNQEIKSKDKKLQQLQAQLKSHKAKLNTDGQDIQIVDEDQMKDQETAIIDLTEKLKEQNDKIQEQSEQLKKQNKVAETAVLKLANVNEDNKSLSIFQVLFYVFLLITIIAISIAFMMWKKVKDSALNPSLPSGNESNSLISVREQQLIKSENFAALGYIATDTTYAVGLSLDDFQAQLESTNDTKNLTTLKSIVNLLESFNIIAADQDDTKVQSFDLIAYIQKMLMLYDFEFKQSNVVYNYSGEQKLIIKSVPSYIALVLLNVINNSLKHGFDNNGNGKITLKAEKGAKGGAIITYSDDGKGMNKATLEQVFKPFFTTHSDRDYVGVGMSTTYDLIKNKLAGDIKIDSQKGKGTTITITLP